VPTHFGAGNFKIQIGYLGREMIDLIDGTLDTYINIRLNLLQIVIYSIEGAGQILAFHHQGLSFDITRGVGGQIMPGIPEFAHGLIDAIPRAFIKNQLDPPQGLMLCIPPSQILGFIGNLGFQKLVVRP